LDENPVYSPVAEDVDGVTLIILINDLMAKHVEMLVYLPRLIAELENGETETLEIVVSHLVVGTVI
jgi:hypothetical protein